jgi:hypothetical protein
VQEANVAGRRVDHPARGGGGHDPIGRRELGDLRAEDRVLALERRGVLDRAADGRVQAQQHDLHRHDPDQREGDQRDPGAAADQAIEERMVDEPPEALVQR